MEKRSKSLIIAVTLLTVLAGIVAWFALQPKSETVPEPATTPFARVFFECNGGKTVLANFFRGSSTIATSGVPVPGGSVAIVLSDGRQLELPQTISADGGRYANTDESIVFWTKGNGAFLLENNVQTFGSCVRLVDDPGGLTRTYADSFRGFSIRFPEGYEPDPSYQYQAFGPGKEILGVKFLIPTATATGTNLSSDSGISVEQISSATTCTAALFSNPDATISKVTDGEVTYSTASSSDAGAGNRYDEIVYAIPGTNPCTAIRYFIHSMAFENYPAGTVQRFDHTALIDQFDRIRRSLTISP